MPRTKTPPTTTDKAKKVVKKTKAVKATAPAAPAASTIQEAAPVVTPNVAETISNVPPMAEDFTAFMSKLQQVNALLSGLRADFRALEKKATRELKAANKANNKRKRKQGNRSPSLKWSQLH